MDAAKRNQTRTERMQRYRADNVQVNPLPAGMSQITMRGGHTLLGIKQGDDVELYADTGEKDKGAWTAGYVACGGTETGEAGSAYDGQGVVFVCKSEDWKERSGKSGAQGAQEGAYWPRQYVRLARGQKSAFADPQTPMPSKEERLASETQGEGA